ncbi:unnamed protein product, partial [Discosporangium mesarthrocarpum]
SVCWRKTPLGHERSRPCRLCGQVGGIVEVVSRVKKRAEDVAGSAGAKAVGTVCPPNHRRQWLRRSTNGSFHRRRTPFPLSVGAPKASCMWAFFLSLSILCGVLGFVPTLQIDSQHPLLL